MIGDPDGLSEEQRLAMDMLRFHSSLPVPDGQCPCCWRLDHHERERLVHADGAVEYRTCEMCGHWSVGGMGDALLEADPDEIWATMRRLMDEASAP